MAFSKYKRLKEIPRRRWIVWGSVSLVFALLLWLLIIIFSGYHGDAKWIYVTREMDNAALRDSLKSKLGDTQGGRIYWLYKIQGGETSESVGAYCIRDGENAITSARHLATGNQSPVKVTFISSRTLDDVADKISSQLAVNKKDFLEELHKQLNAKQVPQELHSVRLIPDTYEMYWSAKPEKVVSKLLESYDAFWNKDRKAKAEKLGLTPDQATIIASIVEEETAQPDEMGKVARVYLNRLKKGMKLQADPTVKFAAGDPTLRRITGRQIAIESPYNTYRVEGLPPGAIRIPSGSTIDSVLNAPVNNNIYMCARADFSGFHDFTDNYSIHQRNAARYQAALDERGIK